MNEYKIKKGIHETSNTAKSHLFSSKVHPYSKLFLQVKINVPVVFQIYKRPIL